MSKVLAGKTVVVTASRRAEEQAAAFERRGARVIVVPTVRIVRTDDDTLLLDETGRVLDDPPQMVLVTTGYGLKSWLETVDKTDMGPALRAVLAAADIYVRGAKGRGAVRGLGFQDAGMAVVETTRSLVDLALTQGVAGKSVTIQQHGQPDPSLVDELERAGAQVTQVHPNRWVQPREPEKVDALIDAVVGGEVDAITFTAAPAVEALVSRAETTGRGAAFLDSLGRVRVAAVGPVTAQSLEGHGISPLVPERSRLGAMIKELINSFSSEP